MTDTSHVFSDSKSSTRTELGFWFFGLFIVCIAAFLRVSAVIETEISHPIRADAAKYYSYAFNLKFHNLYSGVFAFAGVDAEIVPDALVTPGYPLFLSFFMDQNDIGVTLRRVYLAQAVLSTLVVLLFAIIIKLTLSPAYAVVGALLVAINPHLINSNVYLLTESLFTFELAVFFLCVVLCIVHGRTRWFVLSGIALGFASITRPSVLYFIFILALVFFAFSPSKKMLKNIAVLVLVFMLLPVAWSVRNLANVENDSGSILMANFIYHGSFPGFMYDDDPRTFGFPYRFDPHNSEISGKLGPVLHRVAENFQQSPGAQLHWYFVGKPVFLYSWEIIAGAGDVFIYPPIKSPYFTDSFFNITHRLSKLIHLPLLSLCFLAVVLVYLPSVRKLLSANQWHICVIFSAFLLYFTGLHIVGAPFPRYGVPVRPVIVLLGILPLFLLHRLIQLRVSGDA